MAGLTAFEKLPKVRLSSPGVGGGGFCVVTQLVERALEGDAVAYESLRVAVYELILEVAPRRLRGERKDHTFQVTALANEIWKRLDERKMLDVLARRTTPATKALIGGMIRHFLIDYGRRRLRRFRAEGHHQQDLADVDIELDLSAFAAGAKSVTVTIFVDALEKLAELDAEASEVFNQRVFAGLKSKEIAEMLNRAVRTVQLAYRRAQVILSREIQRSIPA